MVVTCANTYSAATTTGGGTLSVARADEVGNASGGSLAAINVTLTISGYGDTHFIDGTNKSGIEGIDDRLIFNIVGSHY